MGDNPMFKNMMQGMQQGMSDGQGTSDGQSVETEGTEYPVSEETVEPAKKELTREEKQGRLREKIKEKRANR